MFESRKNIKKNEQQPLYKMKMFTSVGSKVMEGLKSFKTYDKGSEPVSNNKDNLESIIQKIENELKEIETNEKDINNMQDQ